ncbi:MAG: hypothetical protein R2713_06555 [Ilumatobacteraceae bacterium]
MLTIADRGYVLRTGEIVAGCQARPRRPTGSVRGVRGRFVVTGIVQNLIDGLAWAAPTPCSPWASRCCSA